MIDGDAQIEQALARLGAEHEPPAGWEARVLAAIAEPPRRRWWMTWQLPALASAAAAAVIAIRLWPGPAPLLALHVDVTRGAPVRGAEAQLGEVVHVAATGGSGERAIWIYCDEVQLVLRCPGDRGCAASGDALAADLVLRQVGSYRIVALSAPAALPPPTGSYDTDIAAARTAGAAIEERPLRVQ